MDKLHAKLAPSASERWIACPGSIRLAAQVPPQKEKEYTAEGTAAHQIGAACLMSGKDAASHLGEKIVVGNFSFIVDDNMVEAVQVYLDVIRKHKEATDAIMYVEESFDLSWLIPGCFGSSDCALWSTGTKTLYVHDYKHGEGVVVDPEWNSQLMMYALGVLHRIWLGQTDVTRKALPVMKLVDFVELVIVQPRAFHGSGTVRRWKLSTTELVFWALTVLKPAAKATQDPNAPLHVGEHCRFCPAVAVCPEVVRSSMAVAKTTFLDPVLPDPAKLTPEDITKVLKLAEIFGAWSGNVKEYAQSLMEQGTPIPGYKLVQKKANRVWIDEVQAEQRLKQLIGEAAYAKKLLSIAQAEKVLKDTGLDPKANLDGLWEKPDKGVVMAPDSDKRQAVQSPALLAFSDTRDFLQ